MSNEITIADLLFTISCQIRAVALGLVNAGEETEFNRNALRGCREILNGNASALDDISALPLPAIIELGDEAKLLGVAQLRIENRRASDLIERVKRLGDLRSSNLSERLSGALDQAEALSCDLNDIDTEGLDDRCYEILKNIRQRSSDIAKHVESCIAEVRYQHDSISSVLTALEVSS